MGGMNRRFAVWKGLALCGFALFPAASAKNSAWASKYYRNHPLVGQILRADGTRTTWQEMVSTISQADYVLLGESHKNHDHHIQHRQILVDLSATHTKSGAPRIGGLLFEHLTRPQAENLRAWISLNPLKESIPADILPWSEGWDPWTWYEPMVRVATTSGVPVGALAIEKTLMPRVRAADLSGVLTADEARQFGLLTPLSPVEEAVRKQEMADAHCGYIPEAAMLGPFLYVQRVRDAFMAKQLVEASRAARGGIVVGVLGNGHARHTSGVPNYLRHGAPSAAVVSILWLEVDPGQSAVSTATLANMGADYVLFTPVADLTDPCVDAESLKNLKPNR